MNKHSFPMASEIPLNLTTQKSSCVIHSFSLYWVLEFLPCYYVQGGPGSVVGIATGYGLDGTGKESQWGRNFPHLSRPALGPPSFMYNWYRVFPGGKERPWRVADPSPPSSAVGHERLELYLYSPYGTYGLYKASVPVQGCTLAFFFYCVQGAKLKCHIHMAPSLRTFGYTSTYLHASSWYEN